LPPHTETTEKQREQRCWQIYSKEQESSFFEADSIGKIPVHETGHSRMCRQRAAQNQNCPPDSEWDRDNPTDNLNVRARMVRCGPNRYRNAKTTEKKTCQKASNSHEQIISHKRNE